MVSYLYDPIILVHKMNLLVAQEKAKTRAGEKNV